MRTPVCSPRYEIGWDHFDASMSSYISLSLSLSPSALKTSLTPTVLSCTCASVYICVCVPSRANCVRRVRMRELVLLAKCDITRTVYRMHVCVRIRKRSGIRNRRMYLTLEQISLIIRYSPTAMIRFRRTRLLLQ